MIKFKNLSWRNFLSTGDSWTTVVLDRSPSTLIVGSNGAGKSTMIDALSFGLFGKSHRSIKKAQLINTINKKDCQVTVDFEIGAVSYRVIRGQKPNRFEIYIDDKLVDQSSNARDYQTYLEQNILKLNHKSFHQIVVLGASSFVPFMQLPAGHRRDVIEDVLDIQVFGLMNQILKSNISKVKDELRSVDGAVHLANNSINLQKKHIREIQVLNESHIASKIKNLGELNTKITEIEEETNGLTKDLESCIIDSRARLKTVGEQVKQLSTYEVGIKSGIKRLTQEAKFYEQNDDCPTCKQEIDGDFKQEKLQTAREKTKELKEGMEKCIVEIRSAEELFKGVSVRLESLNVRENKRTLNYGLISQYKKQVTTIEDEIGELQSTEDDMASLAKANKDLEVMNSTLLEAMTKRVALGELNNYNSVIYEILKDTGIKTKIIRQYLPMINQLINQYLQVMDFYVSFYLDESFSEIIKSRHRDVFSYDSFSEGEKMKIDLAILFTWRDVARVKNSMSTNLLILDETFDSSLDADGIENLIKILLTLSEGTNLFVISHKGEILENKFRSKIEFKKEKNFSRIA
jgi:DNA repair exonuclease SbcCD ATPase subunit